QRAQICLNVLRGLGLAFRLSAAVVRGVDANEIAGDARCFLELVGLAQDIGTIIDRRAHDSTVPVSTTPSRRVKNGLDFMLESYLGAGDIWSRKYLARVAELVDAL